MIVLTHPGGHAAVLQEAHARMCGQLARAWGNERFGTVAPAADVLLAADQHEIGMRDWDLAPELDAATGLPKPVTRMKLSTHLPLRLQGPELLEVLSPYAALVASLHHTSFYEKPPLLGLVRRRGRQIRAYLRRSAAFQARLKAAIDAPDAEIERNWRLVRTWDGLSHVLMYGRAPQRLEAVPAADGQPIDLHITVRNGAHVVNPWPFGEPRLEVAVEGRLLEGTFDDRARMHEALAKARRVELAYELVPA